MEVLRLREFRLLFIAQAVSGLGDRTVPIALAFAVLELGGSATAVGLVLTARMLPLTLTLLIGGVVADRISRRTVMVAADIARTLTQALLAALLIAGVAELWTVALLVGLTGAAGGFSYPAATGAAAGDRAARSSCRRPTGCGRPCCRRGRSPARQSPGC